MDTKDVDGDVTTVVFGLSNPESYESAVEEWCAERVDVTAGALSHDDASGAIRVQLVVNNRTSSTIEVSSQPYSVGGAHWTGATTSVAPGSRGVLEIDRTGVTCGVTPTPWDAGVVTVDGQPDERVLDPELCG